MIKDKIVVDGIDVPCFFVEVSDEYKAEVLGLLQGCDPLAAYAGLCGYFEDVALDLGTKVSEVLSEGICEAMYSVCLPTKTFYFPSHAATCVCVKTGISWTDFWGNDRATKEAHIRKLWLDRQIELLSN